MHMGQKAYLYYGDGYFDIMSPGDHVECAVTGRKVHLEQLLYWSSDLQEAYISASVAAERAKETPPDF